MRRRLMMLGFIFHLASCATMFNSGSQTIQARSAQGVEGVSVDVIGGSGSYQGKLPLTITEAPSTFVQLEIKVTDKCYNQNTTKVARTITPSFWANIFNGLWGMLIDPFTGAMWKYDNNVQVQTEPSGKC